MKKICEKIISLIVTIIFTSLIGLWAMLIFAFIGMPVIILSVLDLASKDRMLRWYLDTLVVPFKLLGICGNWDEFVNWTVTSNS